MSFLHAIILGLVQGLTEFFPVSSSAHLDLTKRLFGISENFVLFDLATHMGTLLALVLFLKKDLIETLYNKEKRWTIFVALIPLVPVYVLLKPLRVWAGQPEFLGYFLMLTAGILLIADKAFLTLRLKQAPLIIGTMQSLALIPGISRSASTICGAKLSGFNARDAVRFSFILSVPTILGGLGLESVHAYMHNEAIPKNLWALCLVGGIVSFVSGLVIVRLAMRILEKGKFKPFAGYCLLLGILVTIAYR